MTKDFYFNTEEAMDKAKADRDKPVTPVEYIPVISEVGSDSNMVFPDTMYGLLPKGTGKITLHESKPAPMTKDEALDLALEVMQIKSTLSAFGPDEGVTFTQDTWAKLHAAMSAVVAQPAPVQEPVEVDQTTMELAESVGLIGPASRTHDLHAAIQRFHDLICVNATIKAAKMAADAIRESTPLAAPVQEPEWKQIAEDLRFHGLTLVKTATGYTVLKLGAVEAQAIPPAAKRPFVGLTDEEMDNFVKAVWGRGVTAADFIRAIEAKLKEKNT